MQKQYKCKRLCYWGPTPGTQTLYYPGDVVMAFGTEPNVDEFFDLIEKEPEKPAAKGKKAAKIEEL